MLLARGTQHLAREVVFLTEISYLQTMHKRVARIKNRSFWGFVDCSTSSKLFLYFHCLFYS